MFGYDWPRLHAALNDLPAALLLVSVLFDLAGAFLKRETLRTVGFWTLLVGVVGTAAAVVAGLQAEGVIDHSDDAHAIMEVHETVGFIVLVLFGLLAAWRLWRRGEWTPRERPVALAAGVIGLGLLIFTAQLGGTLVFDHALGIPTARLHAVEAQREGEGHEHAPGEAHDMDTMDSTATRPAASDSVRATPDGAKPHTHADSNAHTRKNEED